MIQCTVWWSPPLSAEPHYLEFLDSTEFNRFSAYRNHIDRQRFLTGRVLAKTLTGNQLGQDPKTVRFDASCPDCEKQHGPPRVLGSSIALSISHSGERIGVAMAESAAIGLDVESTKRRVEDSLISYALNTTETASLTGLTPDSKASSFFAYWTRKEALMKASGKGLRIPLSALTISPPEEPAQLIESTDLALNPATTQLIDLNPGEGYRAAIAILTNEKTTITEQWWQADLA